MREHLNLQKILIKYYSITHGPAIKVKGSTPLLVGAFNNTYLGDELDSYVNDNTHENISILNPLVNEITGIYWVAKNVDSEEIVGFCHYRRWFKHINDKEKNLKYATWLKSGLKRVVLVKPYVMEINLIQHFDYRHIPGNFQEILNVLRDYDANHYCRGLKYFEANKLYPFNMMILNQKNLKDYMNWLYPLIRILVEKYKPVSNDQYQNRLLGFAAERLTGYYFVSRGFDIRLANAEGHGIKHSLGTRLNSFISNLTFKLKGFIGHKRFNK